MTDQAIDTGLVEMTTVSNECREAFESGELSSEDDFKKSHRPSCQDLTWAVEFLESPE